jgi:hypothetical protein
MIKSKKSKKGELVKMVKSVDIKYSQIKNGQFSDEVVVALVSSIGNINMILPRSFLNESKKTIRAIIIDQEKDKYLIELPNETFTTGPRVWFHKSDVLV